MKPTDDRPFSATPIRPTKNLRACTVLALVLLGAGSPKAMAQRLDSVFPGGLRAGEAAPIELQGQNLSGVTAVLCSHPGVTFRTDGKSLIGQVAKGTPPGQYDIQAVCKNGVSSIRSFFVTSQRHVLESAPDSIEATVQEVSLNSVISGRIAKGDVDEFQFNARRGDRVVIECWANRIDSALRAVIEVRDDHGRLIDVSRGYFGVDPLIAFEAPSDGRYFIRLYDLVYSGGLQHVYRLDVGVGPRVVYAFPPAIRSGAEEEITLYGWNLSGDSRDRKNPSSTGGSIGLPFESKRVRLSDLERTTQSLRRRSIDVYLDEFSYLAAEADAPLRIGRTELPISISSGNQSRATAQPVAIPCEAAGRLTRSDQADWYAFDAYRGEVLYVEGFGQRIGSPVDLDVSILSGDGTRELVAFHDELENVGSTRFPSSHLDPAGRWVAPRDGRYLIVVRNLTGGSRSDERRVYRLSLRREEPDVRLVAMAHGDSPAGINCSRGGHVAIDVLAFRTRGMNGSIRIRAKNLPPGVSCPDVWIGPNQNRSTLVVSTDRDFAQDVVALDLSAESDVGGFRRQFPVHGGAMIQSGRPNGSGRIASPIRVGVAGETPARLVADAEEPRDHHLYGKLNVRYSPGGIVDVAVRIEREDVGHSAPVRLTCVSTPDLIANQIAEIPEGKDNGYLSLYLPPSLPAGEYTVVVRGETTVLGSNNNPRNLTLFSNAVTFHVRPAAFRIALDLQAPKKIRRGEIVQIKYSVKRVNGFIGKVHTELAAPGKVTDVGGLRGRGVTSVGQNESGTIQVIANDDAKLGLQPFLRLYAVGVVEDKPTYHGSCFLNLEVVP